MKTKKSNKKKKTPRRRSKKSNSMFDVESVLEEAPESTEQLDFDRIQDIEMMGGTTSGPKIGKIIGEFEVNPASANLKQILAAQCIQIRNEQMRDMRKRITFLEKQNEGYIRQVVQSQANMRQVVEALELKQWEVDKIPALESELKLKNEQKRNLLEEKRVCEEKIKLMDAELKKSKVDSDCPICFESTSIERKWTAFLPCGHRTCSECADKISDLPRKGRKCPNCRESINYFLVLEGIYDG